MKSGSYKISWTKNGAILFLERNMEFLSLLWFATIA